MRGVAAVGNLVLLTPAYTALQTRISIVLQSVTVSITSPLRVHRGVIPARRRKSVSIGVKLHVFVVCPKSRPTDYIGGAGLIDVAHDVGVVVASQMVSTDGNCYLKSLCGNWMTFVSCFFYFVLVGVVC